MYIDLYVNRDHLSYHPHYADIIETAIASFDAKQRRFGFLAQQYIKQHEASPLNDIYMFRINFRYTNKLPRQIYTFTLLSARVGVYLIRYLCRKGRESIPRKVGQRFLKLAVHVVVNVVLQFDKGFYIRF